MYNEQSTANNIIIECNHVIEVRETISSIITYCSVCGIIFDIKSKEVTNEF